MGTAVHLVGAGGHARSVLSTLSSLGIVCAGVYDDNYNPGESIFGVPLLGTLADIDSKDRLVLSIGDSQTRSTLYDRFKSQLYSENIIHPSAIVGQEAKLGQHNHVLPGAIINAGARIGNNNILNTASIVCLLYTSPSPRDRQKSRMPSSA